MKVTVHPGRVAGTVSIPGSKSHTIRALLVASLADGESYITGALDSQDTAACIDVLRKLGVEIQADAQPPRAGGAWEAIAADGKASDSATGEASGTRSAAPGTLDLLVRGSSRGFTAPTGTLDCRNSGTTLYLALSLAALHDFPVRFDGDDQLRRRSAGPLLAALESAGARVTREGAGDCVPLTIRGPLRGGEITIECRTSQYLSSLLLAAPLTPNGLDITVPLLNERPYVEMTLSWLEAQGVAYERHGWERFTVPGGHSYLGFTRQVPADFSSATFFLAAAAVTGSRLTLAGLDMADSQGDKDVVRVLERLGCGVTATEEGLEIVGPGAYATETSGASPAGGAAAVAPTAGALALTGGDVDLNAMPDALPALAIVGTQCTEPLRLLNVPQAREKETDRIAVMARAISALGGDAKELPDGLVVYPSELRGGTVDSAGDHRVAMALAVAGLIAREHVTITNAGVAGITFPGFYERLASVGGRLEVVVDSPSVPDREDSCHD